jgi:uncharacterized membrane protein YdjX (TVP38/TMEM64 family)
MKKRDLLTLIVILTSLLLIGIMTLSLIPVLREVITNTTDETVMVQFIESYGFQGVPVLLGLLMLQVIVPFIPSVAIQVLSGLCYGIWKGILINLTGIMFGNLLVFLILRQSQNLLAPFFNRERKHQGFLSAKRLANINNPERIVFFCFLIPGFPNGIAPYVFAGTKVSLKKYLIAALLGSIPSTFFSTFIGERLSHGNHLVALIMTIIIILIVITVLIFKKRIMAALLPVK